MTDFYENESEKNNNFLADVYYYMMEHKCDYQEAIKVIELIYFENKEDNS